MQTSAGSSMNETMNAKAVEAVNKLFRSGLVALQAGQLSAAESAFDKLLKTAPNHAGAINGLGMIAVQRGDLKAARDHWNRAVALAPEFSAPYVNLGNLDRRTAPMQAIENYRLGIARAPNDAQAVFSLASLLESVGMVRDGANLAAEALNRFAKHPGLAAIAAKGAIAEGRAADALAWLEDLPLDRAGRRIAQLVHYTKVQAYDALDQPEEALKSADSGRQVLESLFPDALERASIERADLASIGAMYQDKTLAGAKQGPGQDLVFLVGFPNSGTEELAAVLRRHPQIKLRDDGFSVEKAIHQAFGSPAIPRGLSPETLSESRRAYDLHFGALGGVQKLRVDHMPIASAYAGFLAELFPAARFVRFYRDPIETCLASSMRGYELTPVSSYLLRFESAADLFNAVQSNWIAAAGELQDRLLEISYENAKSDPAGTLSTILAFLGLPGAVPPEAIDAFGVRQGVPAGDWRRYEPFLPKSVLTRLQR